VPAGTSPVLARRAEHSIGRHFAGLTPAQVSGELGRTVRRRRRNATAVFATLVAFVAIAALAAPDHSRAVWTPLAQPIASLMPPELPPLRLLPGNTAVQRGTPLRVRIDAPGRTVATLHWLAAGDVARSEPVAVTGGTAVAVIPRIDAVTDYWVDAPDGAATARYRVTPIAALLLAELAIDVIYPPHVGRSPERYTGAAPLLEVPEGTQLVISGRATRRLGSAALAGEIDPPIPLRVAGDSFSGSFTPTVSGIYQWRLRAGSGGELAARPAPFEVVVVPDAAPVVDIAYPAGDTVIDASRRQGIVAVARDDFGLSGASVASWRARGAAREEVREEALALAGDDRAIIRTVLDVAARDLVPGDTVMFLVRVTDNSPRRQVGESRVIALRLPTMRELRERSAGDAEQMLEVTGSLAGLTAELREATRALERRTAAASARRRAAAQQQHTTGGVGGSGDSVPRMDFRAASQARQLLDRIEELHGRLDAARAQIDALERTMEEAGMKDARLLERIEQLRGLYEQMLSPAARQQLDRMRQAVDTADPDALQKALEAMALQQELLREQLRQSHELMRRAAAEQQLGSLAQEARELATRQQPLARTMAGSRPTPEQAKAQEDLARRARELARELTEVQQRLEQHGEREAAERAAAATRGVQHAAQQMQQAAADAQRQDGASAHAMGEGAVKQLERAADAIDRARQAVADGRREEVQESIRYAASDALSLAQRQQQLAERMRQAAALAARPGGQAQQQGQQRQQGQQGAGGVAERQALRVEQAALQQGLQQLGRSLRDSAQRAGAMSRDVANALASAQLGVQQTLESLQRGELPLDRAQHSADALNRLALSLLNSAQQPADRESGSGAAALAQQLADLAARQGSVNGQTSSMSPMNLSAGAMARQLDRLAAEQLEIARRLGELNAGGRGSVLGSELDAMVREAGEVARRLSGGGGLPPELLARQARLFHRLLDAGRSLERDEYEDERSGERPGRFTPRDPGALGRRLFDGGARFPAPAAEELQALPPAQRRLILDYFERLNRPPPLPPRPAPGPGGNGGGR
jgi:hypothetical protein